MQRIWKNIDGITARESAAVHRKEIGDHMKLLGKYLKPFALPVLLSILLLFGQAMCDLTLPNLMSDIVNTGIQRGGIDEALPAVMNASGEELLAAFMDEPDEAAFRAATRRWKEAPARPLEKDYTAIGVCRRSN